MDSELPGAVCVECHLESEGLKYILSTYVSIATSSCVGDIGAGVCKQRLGLYSLYEYERRVEAQHEWRR